MKRAIDYYYYIYQLKNLIFLGIALSAPLVCPLEQVYLNPLKASTKNTFVELTAYFASQSTLT